MVRLVFRPYTQVSRTICTSVSLCTSIRVSPDFMLLKHSSPSFGSYQISSFSYLSQKIMDGCSCPLRLTTYTYFRYAHGFSTRKLWYVIDSLVRVSRRVYRSRFDKIAKAPHAQPGPTAKLKSTQLFTRPHAILSFVGREPSSASRSGLASPSPSACVSHIRHWPTPIASFSTVSNLLTLFSKFFSSFLHSTCSLSVSHQYLALGEVYPPI